MQEEREDAAESKILIPLAPSAASSAVLFTLFDRVYCTEVYPWLIPSLCTRCSAVAEVQLDLETSLRQFSTHGGSLKT